MNNVRGAFLVYAQKCQVFFYKKNIVLCSVICVSTRSSSRRAFLHGVSISSVWQKKIRRPEVDAKRLIRCKFADPIVPFNIILWPFQVIRR